MDFERLGIEGAWLVKSHVHSDKRGSFREWFSSHEVSEATGRAFDVSQSNISISCAGALRGIHYSIAPHGQAKWVTCISGSVWDVIVDIRPSSPTFKKWIGISLSGKSGASVFISEDLGHGFLSLEDNSAVSYLLNSPYSPADEYGINPLDSDLAIDWPLASPLLSDKDASALTLSQMLLLGKLPN